MVFMTRQRVKDLLLQARIVVRTSNVKISRRRLADYIKALHQKACHTCSTIGFLYSTNPINDLWHCRWLCRRQILNSLLSPRERRWSWRNSCHTLPMVTKFHGHQEFALSLAKSNDLIYTLKLEIPKRQRTLQDFSSNILSDTGIVIFAICVILHVAIKM